MLGRSNDLSKPRIVPFICTLEKKIFSSHHKEQGGFVSWTDNEVCFTRSSAETGVKAHNRVSISGYSALCSMQNQRNISYLMLMSGRNG